MMIPDMHIRAAHTEDAAAIADLINPIICAGCYTVLDTLITIEVEREFIAKYPSRGVFSLAFLPDGTLGGIQHIEPFAAHHAFDHVGSIHTYVSLTHRRCGIGSRLFRYNAEVAARKGYEKLFACVRADNPAALAAYQRNGFQIIGTARHQAKIRGKYVDQVLVEKSLLA